MTVRNPSMIVIGIIIFVLGLFLVSPIAECPSPSRWPAS